jgi:hypothetical protein
MRGGCASHSAQVSRIAKVVALALGLTLGGCAEPKLNLGDDCDGGYNLGSHDPCASAGLVCAFILDPGGGGRAICQYPFGSVDGGLGLPCTDQVVCNLYGLECEPSGQVDGGLTSSCLLPHDGRCAPSVGCALGYLCLHDPDNGGLIWSCVQACKSSSDCRLPEEHCVLSMGQYVCAIDRCGGSSGNGLPFQACDNAGVGDGYCYPVGVDGAGSCYATGKATAGSLCEVGHSSLGCAPGSLCAPGRGVGVGICLATCVLPGIHNLDGGPGCPVGQACTQDSSLNFSSVTGACVQYCRRPGDPPCPTYTTCQRIADIGNGCLN